MTTIHIAHDVSEQKFNEIANLVQREEIYNVDFSGERFTLDRDDFTSIDEPVDPDYILLMRKIIDIIDGRYE